MLGVSVLYTPSKITKGEISTPVTPCLPSGFQGTVPPLLPSPRLRSRKVETSTTEDVMGYDESVLVDDVHLYMNLPVFLLSQNCNLSCRSGTSVCLRSYLFGLQGLHDLFCLILVDPQRLRKISSFSCPCVATVKRIQSS